MPLKTFCTMLDNLATLKMAPCGHATLARHGISLVIQPHLPRTHLDGAAIVFRADQPIIGLTLRYDRIDNFWFCLLHELWHLRFHFEGEQIEFYDDLDAGAEGTQEKEADEGAGEVWCLCRMATQSRALGALTNSGPTARG
jgi:HTH-type transcriptional regulator/antitoxin HigA